MSTVHLTAHVVITDRGIDGVVIAFDQLRAAGVPGTAKVSTLQVGQGTQVSATWTVTTGEPEAEIGGGW